MNCAVCQPGEFSAITLQGEPCRMGESRLGESSVKIVLDRLVKKKLIKKRYVWEKYLKFCPIYYSCIEKEFYLSNTVKLDISNDWHKKVWEQDQNQKAKKENNFIYRYLHYYVSPCIIEPEYLSDGDREELRKKIAEL